MYWHVSMLDPSFSEELNSHELVDRLLRISRGGCVAFPWVVNERLRVGTEEQLAHRHRLAAERSLSSGRRKPRAERKRVSFRVSRHNAAFAVPPVPSSGPALTLSALSLTLVDCTHGR
jgi:hypothetical protein